VRTRRDATISPPDRRPFETGRSAERHRIEALASLDGVFRRSFWELFYFGEAIAGSLLVVALCVHSSIGYLRLDDPSQRPFAWILIAIAVAFSVFPVWAARRLPMYYEFHRGSVRCVRGKGKTIWSENLAGVCATKTSGGFGPIWWITLRWSDHSRRIEFFESIRKALRNDAPRAPTG
jgi:hypothetical protein